MVKRETIEGQDKDKPMIRRKNYFIKKRFQMGFIYRFILLLLLESLLIAGLFMYISSDTLTTGYFNYILKIERTSDFFFISFLLITSIVVIGMAMIGMAVFILLSHRIAGPLYRFEKDLAEMAQGDLTKRIALRKTDQLTELKEALNILIDSFDQRIGRMKHSVSRLSDLLSKKDDPENIQKLSKEIELLKSEIDNFKVTPRSEE